ncbi:MAG: hypothetical protein E7391_04185 [Ruminococcaceae bacterium]|nr:hypothetical protein [Oscillospiraceae bacterium]
MKDNEIIKALECCRDCKCKECPCYNKETGGCKEIDEQDILDLINREKEEIERLQSDNVKLHTIIPKMLVEAKFEAIKEFAERLKEKVEKVRLKYQRLCKEQGEKEDEVMNIHFKGIEKLIDNLVKEMELGK